MIEYIDGELVERTPTFGVIETGGIGYIFQTTLNTFESLNGKKRVKIYMHTSIREDAHVLFGFSHESERTMFRSLISVSGIGPASAIASLSTYNPIELRDAIVNGDVAALKKIKGIGAKSAERIIVDLKDKMGGSEVNFDIFGTQSNTLRSEALRALRNLGFDQRKAQVAVDKVLESNDQSITIEKLIKLSLRSL